MLSVIRGVSEKQVLADKIIQLLEKMEMDGYLYIGYPVLGGIEGRIQIDALLVSPKKGVVIFDLDTSSVENLEKKSNQLDDLYVNMEARLKKYSGLSEKRRLQVKISVVSYVPGWKNAGPEICISMEALRNYISGISWEENRYYGKLLESIQMISQIKKRGKREYVRKERSRGAKLKNIEDQIACLDKYQSKAVIETVDGVQRIRGLAGSGKTIVLALKVAYLYTVFKDKKIAVTFNSRSLKEQFRELITNFIIENTNEEPDWERIKIIHAWGSASWEGLYYDFCRANSQIYYDYQEACRKYGRSSETFEKVCQEAVENVARPTKLFDVILVDEAQDFSKYFLQMCYMSLPKEKPMLVYAYDELQSLDGNSLGSPEEIFGCTAGKPRVVLDNHEGRMEDIVLYKCYRNPRPLLTTAHSLGFGIYRPFAESTDGTGLVQLFEDKKLWEAIGYTIDGGVIEDGKPVSLRRTEETSPVFLENHSDINDLIRFRKFQTAEEEADWVVADILENLSEEELKYKDIMIIHPEPKTTKGYVSAIRLKLAHQGVKTHIVGVQTPPELFFQDDSIAICQIYRAKGNEAAMVYVVNADLCADGINLARKRNILFTAITRSKAWVRVSGIGDEMDKLIGEYEKVLENHFCLNFVYPTEKQRSKMRIIHRDKTRTQITEINKSNHSLAEIITSLENGDIQTEDINPALLKKLKEVLLSGGN